MSLFFEKLNELHGCSRPFVLVTVVDTIGSVPQDVGSKMLVTSDGLYYGTVGGGKVEARAIVEAKSLLEIPGESGNGSKNRHASSNTRFWNWSLNKDIGMTCGGSVKMFMEAFHSNPWRLTVFGAGHICNAIMQLLVNLDCQITCLDTRQEWLNKLPEHKRLTKICSNNLVADVKEVRDGDFILLMTMGHSSDMPVLIEILKTRSADVTPYIGVIGSDAKAARLRKDVLEAGLSNEDTKRFFCPMGLTLGTNDPHEIAVSISAQLLQVRDELRARSSEAKCVGVEVSLMPLVGEQSSDFAGDSSGIEIHQPLRND